MWRKINLASFSVVLPKACSRMSTQGEEGQAWFLTYFYLFNVRERRQADKRG
jgi:hypothetical protein